MALLPKRFASCKLSTFVRFGRRWHRIGAGPRREDRVKPLARRLYDTVPPRQGVVRESVWVVQVLDDDGQTLNAEYAVETDGSRLALIMESRSGTSGARPPRNPDYNQALKLLLRRLGQLNAVLVDALVDSRHVRDLGLPDADRRLIEAPIRLALEPDMEALRRRMGTAQAKIAQAPDATKGGNATKRIRLRLQVPGYPPGDARRLAATLAVSALTMTPIFVLAWHPQHYQWEKHGYAEAIEVTAAGGTWSALAARRLPSRTVAAGRHTARKYPPRRGWPSCDPSDSWRTDQFFRCSLASFRPVGGSPECIGAMPFAPAATICCHGSNRSTRFRYQLPGGPEQHMGRAVSYVPSG